MITEDQTLGGAVNIDHRFKKSEWEFDLSFKSLSSGMNM